MANNRPIGLFDSGVGGLSVLLEIKRLLPKENFVFLADQAHNPYGQKTQKELESLSESITRFLVSHQKTKLLVVACNTATCYAIDHLRSKFKIPIIGVVPAIKPAVALSKKGRIAIISTPATAKSQYLKSLITQFAPNSQVLKLGCDGLEEAIEYLKMEKVTKILKKYLPPIKKFGADLIVLGCTHYPFVRTQIQKSAGTKISIIDSGEAIAKRVEFLLQKNNNLSQIRQSDNYYTTADPQIFSKVASTLLKYKITAQQVTILLAK